MTQPTIAKGDALQKISSIGFILGAILIATSELLMPYAPRPKVAANGNAFSSSQHLDGTPAQ